ncbi:MAG: radical SAM protein [Alphaproteobacteria bacterium]|nr:radical SAM protein [Alphaproteobacteria bacterium]
MDRTAYLANLPYLDFYIPMEGEVPFTALLRRLLEGRGVKDLTMNPPVGVMAFNAVENRLAWEMPVSRIQDLEVIPSPYLNGMFDRYLDGSFFPFMETARGCPYHCTYCAAGEEWYRKIASFSVQRICAELDYIAERMTNFPASTLAFADSNFGMLKRDEEIAEHIGEIRKKWNWPHNFDIATGKSQLERIISVSQKMDSKLFISLSVQSTNPDTLVAVKRKNLDDGKLREIYQKLIKLGINSYSDLIYPMPLETKKSFFNGIEKMIQVKINKFIPYTAMILKGTSLASRESRKKYGLVTKFRILPRQFGEYQGEKCFEIEEICVATNTMSFPDYLECRGFSFVVTLYSNGFFEPLMRHLDELEINRFDFFKDVWTKICRVDTPVSNVYSEFIHDAEAELFESREAIYAHYLEPSHYNNLKEFREGDNLIRAAFAKVMMNCCSGAIELGYEVIRSLLSQDADMTIKESLEDAEKWMIATRNLSPVIRQSPGALETSLLSLRFNIDQWFTLNAKEGPLVSFNEQVCYSLSLESEHVSNLIDGAKRLFGEKEELWIPRLLERTDLKNYWRKCDLKEGLPRNGGG